MKSEQSQDGSAHLVIIIVLAIALIGSLGFVLYRNLQEERVTGKDIDPTKVVGPIKTEVASEVALTEVASDTTNDTKFAIKYPKTWTLAHEITPGSDIVGAGDKNTITSPDKAAVVELNVFSSSGRALLCSGNNVNAKVVINDKGDIPGYPSAGFVDYGESTNGDYIGAYDINAIKDNQGCNAYQESRYLLGYANDTLVTLGATFTSKVDMSSDNYKIAKRIIQSLYKKD